MGEGCYPPFSQKTPALSDFCSFGDKIAVISFDDLVSGWGKVSPDLKFGELTILRLAVTPQRDSEPREQEAAWGEVMMVNLADLIGYCWRGFIGGLAAYFRQ